MDSVMLVIVLALLAVAGSARAADEFVISHWCGPTELSKEKFAEVAEANFTVVEFAGHTPENNLKALDLAQECGMKAVIYDNRVMAKGERERGMKTNLENVAKDYKHHPALWGYHIKDEPNSSMFPTLSAINKQLLKVDPKHIPFINIYPNYANSKQMGNPTYEHHIDEFLRVVRPKLLSYDHYALFKDSERPSYFDNMEIIRRQGIKHKTPFNFILQCIPHGPYRDPSENDLRWQVNTALAYGARGIMYFTYVTPVDSQWDFHDAIIDGNGKRTAKYEWVKQINAEVLKLAPTLMKLNSVAVYHTGPVPDGAKPLPDDGLISIDEGQFVVGQFNSDQGRKYAMFVNRDLRKSSRACISFSQKVEIREVSRKTGRLRAVPIVEEGGKWVWRSRFRAGEGKLVQIDLVDDLPVRHWEDIPQFRPRIMLDPSAQFWNIAGSEDPANPDYYCEGLNMYDIACRVRDELTRDGRVDVFMSRKSQTEEVSLEQETSITRSLNCDVLVSLHSDATGKEDDPGGGTWTFYADDVEGKRLAECVQAPLLDSIKTFHPDVLFRGVRTHWWRLWVLHEAGCPGSLTEVLFHSNPQEREMLKNPEYQQIMAKAIAKGILEYFGLR